MKYQVIVNIDGYQETISIHNTPDKAIDIMLKAAKATIAECFKDGTEFSAYPTSDERYPDAWGYANNGYCIKRGKSTMQYTVIEISTHNRNQDKVQLIDLGLPSGTLWADRNIGADSPEGYGDYFRFGEMTPYTDNSQPYENDKIEGDIAGTERDAATSILGEGFHSPTIKQIRELITKCSHEWTEVGRVNGVKVTGPSGNFIFLPASGFRNEFNSSIAFVGSRGYYWSASPYSSSNGRSLVLNSNTWFWNNNNRAYGFPVRAVKG